ncbi:hypothetical protein F0562_025606 [Nyssa sinensis]|uniref:Uncharacterized protein n=1 Tax=Nyssa sinensis TaxID=561372 RepID=A0A5J5B8H0_9ASTE|nr:hypothetical protein F0562_025606 [Nyssa sinensis]
MHNIMNTATSDVKEAATTCGNDDDSATRWAAPATMSMVDDGDCAETMMPKRQFCDGEEGYKDVQDSDTQRNGDDNLAALCIATTTMVGDVDGGG